MCGVGEQMRKKQQRLLKNMDAHKVMLDLLQIPYEKVGRRWALDWNTRRWWLLGSYWIINLF